MDKVYCVYTLTNQRHTVLYVGVTSNLKARVYQHREKLLPGFTERYKVFKLAYYEIGTQPAGVLRAKSRLRPDRAKRKSTSLTP